MNLYTLYKCMILYKLAHIYNPPHLTSKKKKLFSTLLIYPLQKKKKKKAIKRLRYDRRLILMDLQSQRVVDNPELDMVIHIKNLRVSLVQPS